MKIILIAHNLRVAGGKSVGQNIIRTLPQIAPMHEYLMIVPKDCGYPDFAGHSNISVLECPQMGLAKRWWWEKRVMRSAIEAFAPDWIWALGNVGLYYTPCSQSLLLHNPHRLYPQLSPNCNIKDFLFKFLSDYFFKKSLKKVNRIYCQTNTMKKRLNTFWGYPLENIGICQNAISFSVQNSKIFPSELKTNKNKFILFVLTKYYIHKNLERIVDVFDRYRNELKDVVCVMPVRPDQGKKAAKLVEQVEKAGLANQIVFVDPIPQERLGEFFHAADVMFFPTLLESFSGTYLEYNHSGLTPRTN